MSSKFVSPVAFLIGLLIALTWYAAPLALIVWEIGRTHFFALHSEALVRIAAEADIALSIDEVAKFLLGAASGTGLIFAAPAAKGSSRSGTAFEKIMGVCALVLVGIVAITAMVLYFVFVQKSAPLEQEYGLATAEGLRQFSAARFQELISIFGTLSGVAVARKVNG